MVDSRNRGDHGISAGLGAGAWLALLAFSGLASGATRAEAETGQVEKPLVACWQLGAVPGPEDLGLVLDPNGEPSRLLVSSQDRRTDPRPAGAIYSMALEAGSTSGPQPLRLVGRDDCSFHPHGISLVRREETQIKNDEADEENQKSEKDKRPWHLYVINHHESIDTSPSKSCLPEGERLARHDRGFTSVEVFEVRQNSLRFLQRLADPKVLQNGNDLVALPNGDVFITSPPAGVRDLLSEVTEFPRLRRAVELFRLRQIAAVLPPLCSNLLDLRWVAAIRSFLGIGYGLCEPTQENGGSQIVQFECTKTVVERSQTKEKQHSTAERCVGEFRSVARIGRYINGIEARESKEGRRYVYATSTLEDVIYEFNVDLWDGPYVTKRDLSQLPSEFKIGPWDSPQPIKVDPWDPPRSIRVTKGLDNLSWESADKQRLLGAAHPDMRRFLQHAKSPEVPSPAEVWRVSVAEKAIAEPWLADAGSLISAASTAVCVEDDLVLGQVFESAVLRCEGAGPLCGPGSSPEPADEPETEAAPDEPAVAAEAE
ncbi:MAG: hypothetical protein ACE5GX_20490 [Thermoanaerobaculia bacterium]